MHWLITLQLPRRCNWSPDEERGEIIKAFITLRDGHEYSEDLFDDIKKFVRKHLAAHAYPREIQIVDSLPKTRSGKIMRRVSKSKRIRSSSGRFINHGRIS
jgi:acetyl-CoA synthetase